jgi:beta-1,4-mannosyl-glycoprotein beta-1,4-N-acetylglucosaminyltransferase
MLKFRLEYLYDTVDKFVIVEATRTHAGNSKPLYFEQNKHEFSKYTDKIIHVIVNDMPMPYHIVKTKDTNISDAWIREHFQRQCIDRGVQTLNLTLEDVLIISDCDEIPDKNTISIYKTEPLQLGIGSLNQALFSYNFHLRNISDWQYAKVCTYQSYLNIGRSLNKIRYSGDFVINNGGWHCSYFGDIAFIKNKLQQFAHQEYNNLHYTSDENILKCMQSNQDVFGNSKDFKYIEILSSTYLPDNYQYLM